MADKFYNNQNVFVEADYDNIVVVDPNKMVEPDGKVVERLINHEEMVIYANLEAKVLPRTKLALGSSYDDTIQNLRIGTIDGDIESKVNFMKPKGKKYFDTSWTDQLTGDGSLTGDGINQTKVEFNERTINTGDGQTETQYVQKRSVTNQQDTQLLGIDSISIKLNTSYVPVVNIEMTDIQGRMLFEQGENSPYSAFMQMPYPLFNLTIKGYFGKAIRYELMLKHFNARFDASDGNYKISTQYIARTYALLSDIQVESLFTLPRMYVTNTKIGDETIKTPIQTSGDEPNEAVRQVTYRSSIGRSKISEVFDVYKSKGLIDDDMPDLSLNEMLFKLNKFEQYVMEAYGKQDMSVLSDIEKYRALINEYRNKVTGSFEGSWMSKYIDPTRRLVKNDGKILHRWKGDLERQTKKDAISELEAIVKEYNQKLNKNTTFGSKGSCVIDGKRLDTAINCNINYKRILEVLEDIEDINIEKSFGRSNPSDAQLIAYKNKLENEFTVSSTLIKDGEIRENTLNKTTFTFGKVKREVNPLSDIIPDQTFLGKLAKIEEIFENDKKTLVEETLSTALAEKIKSADVGLGFNPTIRNVMAVICASADAFFRLMDKVHEDAWEQRKHPSRLTTVIDPTSAFGSEGKDSIESVSENGQLVNEAIVYPWPQYLELKKDKKGNEEYVNVYPGDSSVAAKTESYDSTIWPEVKFVEEYIRATLEREDTTVDFNFPNEVKNTKYIFTTALEYPFHDNIYKNSSEISFFYEIFERTQISSFFNKINKNNDYGSEIYSVIADMEFLNVNEAVKKSPELTKKLKNYSFSYDNILQLLFNGSKMGSWNIFERDYYVTPYLKNLVENPNTIYTLREYNDGIDINGSVDTIDKLKELLKSSNSNQKSFLDGYPFDSDKWISNYISENGVSEVRKTINTFDVLESKKVISSFSDDDEIYEKKALTNYDWINNIGNNITQDNPSINDGTQTENNLNNFYAALNYYTNRNVKDLFLTESFLTYSDEYNENGNRLTANQTTSLLNTPYFINSLMAGVEKEKQGNQDGYTQLGYMYLNSLPLSNVSEKVTSLLNETTFDGDRLFSIINKFSAVHKQPYLWFLKCGSIWYRYKKFHNDGVDILDEVWKDFDFRNAFDPNGNNINKEYTILNRVGDEEKIQGRNRNTTQITVPNNGESQIVNVDSAFLNVGFYPKVIENIYYYFTEVSLFNTYSSSEFMDAYNNKNLRIDKNSENFLFKWIPNEDGTATSFNQDSWFSYFDINQNTDFLEYNKEKVLLVPSIGDVKFNQVEFECLRDVFEDIDQNNSVHNGSVRSLWSSPNFGYFNDDFIKKPEVNQYLKFVEKDKNNRQPFNLNDGDYSNIEDLINLLGPKVLDKMELMYLDFCKKPGHTESSDIVLDEDTNQTIKNDFNLYQIMSKLFIVDNPNSEDSPKKFLKDVAKNQVTSFTNAHKNKFLPKDYILKMGNPSMYDKRLFNSFSNDTDINPTAKIDFGKHEIGTVPGNGTTLNQSKINNPSAWKAVYLNFGDSDTEGIKYSDDGSIITDFFYDFDIEFSESNVNLLAPIIKMYTSKKLDDDTYTTQRFYNDLNDFITDTTELHRNVLNHLFIKLNSKLPNVEIKVEDTVRANIDGADIAKIDIWETFRLANDKWVSGQDFKERTIFEDFLFLDRANRPVGDKIVVNIEKIRRLLKNRDNSLTVYQLVSEIMTKNGFTFMPTPVYTNFYGRNDRVKEGEPIPQDIPNDLFGTFMEVDTRDARPRMLGIFVGKPSEHVKLNNNNNSRRLDDAFDLTRASDCPLIENTENKTNFSDSNKCVGFNVDFGVRNQGIFKGMSIDMSQHKNIAPTFQVLADMGSMGSQRKVAQQSQSLYNFYKSQSYNCTIESMGNAMIQPTMYFNLRHVPMFTGPYLIVNVSHNITSRDFTTQFEGIRIPKHALDVPDKLVMSVNRELLQSIQEKVRSERVNNSSGGDVSDEVINGEEKKVSQSQCEDKNIYPNKEFVEPIVHTVTKKQILNYLKQQGLSPNMEMYLFVLADLNMENGVVKAFENNIYKIRTDEDGGRRYVTSNNTPLINRQYCVNYENIGNVPMASFMTYQDSIEFMIRKYDGALSTILDDLVDAEYANGQQTNTKWASALAKFWSNTTGKVEGSNYIEINRNVSEKMTTDQNFGLEYTIVKGAFENAIESSLL